MSKEKHSESAVLKVILHYLHLRIVFLQVLQFYRVFIK